MDRATLCKQIDNILPFFAFDGKIVSTERYGSGHINDTFLGITEAGKQYIIQRINTDIFTDPEGLMNNIKLVCDHIRQKIAARGGDTSREVMTIVPTLDGKLYCTDVNGSAWRVYDFVTDSLSLDRPRDDSDSYLAIKAFGEFTASLADFDASLLCESIPDFHNTPKRYSALMNAVTEDNVSRAVSAEHEIKFVHTHEKFTRKLVKSGMPLRVTHNDTKLNNILLDAPSGKALCVIDLDTIMPGYAMTDFGDYVRFCCTTAAEDESDLSKVDFDIDMFEKCVAGFIAGCGGDITQEELRLLPDGAIIMTLECGIRFLTDYLEGDTYFRTEYPEHNFVRCRNQFRLVERMEANLDKMRDIIEKYL